MIYFTSDLHFFHKNVIAHAGRPFRSVEEMDHALIENWNRRVQSSDEVYILGDLTMKGATFAASVLEQLAGRKYLIRGNHDRFVQQKTFPPGLLEWVRDYHEMKWNRQRLILCHYPLLTWNHEYRGAIHLHGHQHNGPDYNLTNRLQGIRRYDVGADANHFAPVSVEEILAFFAEGGETSSK